MASTFSGLELSRRALSSQQIALNVTGHNISNSNTQGYTRQIANLIATTPDTLPAMGRNLSLGSGVTVDTITRARDAFVDRQFRTETSKQQYWVAKQDSLTKVEDMINEPSDNSLSNDMNQFWVAWSDLSKGPENAGARSVVRERALTLTDSLHAISTQISDRQNDLNSQVNVQISQINVYGEQIKDLNEQIKQAEVNGDNPNDLRDSRDNLVDELSKIVNVRVIETKDPNFTDRQVNNFRVDIGNEITPQTLVDGGEVNKLEGVTTQSGIGDNDITTVQWVGGSTLDLGQNMGTLQANIETRDTYLVDLQAKYDKLAAGIITAVNELHGTEFFDASKLTASNIELATSIKDDINNIVTGDGAAGDGSIATAISSLSTGWSALTADSQAANKADYGTSLGDYYGASVAQLGVDVQQANRMKAGEDVLLTNVTNQRESLSGVSLDEEMTNLIKFQKSYSAAARMVTMMDDMLSTLMNMGVTR
ncbi:MAG TPA: flagellar hook-associated protein FlgK [Desulfosporosinus sp.]|nr:flagellar hook-associated protein FlgK [Desulfosporosinus sp.]